MGQLIAEWISIETGLNRSKVGAVLDEISDALLFFNCRGQGVSLEGVATFLPSIRLDGSMRVHTRMDTSIKRPLNVPGYFIGEIHNRGNIGKSTQELIDL